MDRRAFLVDTGAVLLAGPLAAQAQEAGKTHRVGILGNVPLTDPGSTRLWGEFAQGLKDLGHLAQARDSDPTAAALSTP